MAKLAAMNATLSSPLRILLLFVAFVLAVGVLATTAYMAAGWSFSDAVYMVTLTVYSVGYGEVHPIDTPYLHMVTMATMILGCTGMILVTGALVQLFTVSQIQQLLGFNRVKNDIGKLNDHVIICGLGRIGVMLAKELSAGGVRFVVLERDQKRVEQALALGYLGMQGDATDETLLLEAGVQRARTLATVLPDDAANVFITLSARSLNPTLQIIARGEAPSTEGKLIHAGASKVILPTHIGAERIAELILFPEAAQSIRGSDRGRGLDQTLTALGLEVEVALAAEGGPIVGMTIEELERRAEGSFLVVQITRREGAMFTRPSADTRIEAGDGLTVIGRNIRSLDAMLRPGA